VLCTVVAVVVIGTLVGCGDAAEDTTPSVGPGEPVVPASPDLSDPERAVASYLDWVSFAYRMANSDIPTQTLTPIEGVRVDAYIELNRQENRAIEQSLVAFELRGVSAAEPTATVTAHEEWEYRYFTLDTIVWSSDPLSASYETTYTLVQQPDGRWLVDDVDATPLTPVE
jgi:hypothetical protein